jgi:Uma2 family endonuclease
MVSMVSEITVPYKRMTQRKVSKLPKTGEEYLHWNPRNGFKYEWLNGKLLKSDTMIQPEQQFIADNLLDIFNATPAYTEGGRLSVAVKSKTLAEHYRVPDMAYFTPLQRKQMMEMPVAPQLAIEILSKTDTIYDSIDKVKEYFDAGVKMVLWIIPPIETIYQFRSVTDLVLCYGDTVCDASGIAKRFAFKTKEIFQKP